MGEENPESVIITDREQDVTFPKNVHLIPAKRKLESIDLKLLSKDKFIILQDSLIEPLERLRGMYDYIFLDTAPNATTPTIAAYKAADWFLLTATPDPFAIAGLKEALDDIKSAQRRGNPKLRLLGVVLSNMDTRTRLALTLSEYVDKAFATHGAPSLKFQTNISRSTVIPKAQEKGKTLFQTEPGHKVADQYRALSQELESRLSQFEERQESSPSEPSTSTEASATQQGEFPQAKEALANE
jgi:chromosome partitioning protein